MYHLQFNVKYHAFISGCSIAALLLQSSITVINQNRVWSVPGGLSMIRMSNGPHSTWLSIILSTNYEANPGPKLFWTWLAIRYRIYCTACQSNSDFPYFEPVPKERHHNFLVSQLQSSTERAGVKNITLCAISGFLFKESEPFLLYIGIIKHLQFRRVNPAMAPQWGVAPRSDLRLVHESWSWFGGVNQVVVPYQVPGTGQTDWS